MSVKEQVEFCDGNNIAMKVPAHEHAATVSFYRDVAGLSPVPCDEGDAVSEFGDKVLWIDRVERISQAEIWLEICCNDVDASKAYFEESGQVLCEGIEKLPDVFKGFWSSNPSNIVHLISVNGSP